MLRAAEHADQRRSRRTTNLPPDEPMQIERSVSDELILPDSAIPISTGPPITASQRPITSNPPTRAATANPAPRARTANPTPRAATDDGYDGVGNPRRRARRMSSGPVYLPPGAPLASVPLSAILPGPDPSPRDDGSLSGILIIPIDEDPIYDLTPAELVDADDADTRELGHVPGHVQARGRARTLAGRAADDFDTPTGTGVDISIDIGPAVEAEPPVLRAPRAPSLAELDEVEEDPVVDASVELDDGDGEDPQELSVEDLEEVGEGGIRPYSATARRALAATPLFSSLPAAALEQLIDRIQLVDLEPGQVLFRQGDAGVNLYVVVEGAVRVYTEGPPVTELMILGPGSFFGEIALVTDTPRSATVQVEQPTQLLSIDRDAVRALMHDQPDVLPILLRFVRERLVDSLVRTHPMFAPFGDPDRRALIARFRFIEIDPGTSFVEQGVRTAGLYVLMAGRADILRDGDIVATLNSGDLVGETSVLDGSGSPVTVRSDARCLALFLPRADFQEIIMTHPQVLSYIGDLADERARAWASSSPASMRVKMV